MKFIRRLLNLDTIDKLNRDIDIHIKRTEQLEEQLSELESIKLELRVTKLYVEDSEAILELLEAAEKVEKNKYIDINRMSLFQDQQAGLANMAQDRAFYAQAQGFSRGFAGALLGNLIH